MGGVNDQMGDQGPHTPPPSQDRYYQRYLQDTDPTLRSSGGAGTGGRNALIAAGVIAALALGGVGIWALTGGDDEQVQGGASPTTTATTTTQTTTTSASTTSTTTSSSPTVDLQQVRAEQYGPALKPGWKIVAGTSKSNAAYDVPDNDEWEPPQHPGDLQGWLADNKEDKGVVASAPSEYGKGHCPTAKAAATGFIGFVNIGTRDPAEAAPSVIENVAKLITYDKKTKKYLKYSPARTRQITVNGGKTPAIESLMTMDVANPEAKRCEGKKAEARVVAFSGSGVSVMLLISRDMDTKKKMSDQDILDIINSLRPKK